MTTRDRTRDDAVKQSRQLGKRAAKLQSGAGRGSSTADAAKDVVDLIPSDEFQQTARRVAARRAGLLKRLAE